MTDASDWRTLDAALDRALDLDGAERAAYLDGLDAPLREAVLPLLKDALADDPLLDHFEDVVVAATEGVGLNDSHVVVEGARVGPYCVEALIGEGGMGRVYRARRADGVFDKTVALKVVRASLTLAGADVAARLRHERDLLAALDHPGIARLLDGGETGDGVPYLVTELVDGVPITDYADARALGVRQRVRLVVEVARAVDHAHRRFVVHRDLKPSNVLVTEGDGGPRPIVLDFGIAKLLDEAEGSGAFPLTRTGLRLLTPAYAAPELYAAASPVTAAADVYGLGALLYELLTGHRPHEDMPTSGPPTAEPTRPSKRVTEPVGGTSLAETASRARALRGDLDVICLKALHPDPARRYGSAALLADDLERFLDGRPVEAQPDSMTYVVGRFVRRNRALVGAASVAAVALVVGLAVALVALGQARRAQGEAVARADEAEAVSGFLTGLFEASNPEQALGADPPASALLAAGRARIDGLADQPQAQGRLLLTLGQVYDALGRPVAADSLFAEAESAFGRAGAWGGVAEALAQQTMIAANTRHAAAADSLGAAAIAAARRAPPDRGAGRALTTAHSARADRDLPALVGALAYNAFLQGRPDSAEARLRRALVAADRAYGPADERSLRLRGNLAIVYEQSGRLDEAERMFRQTAEDLTARLPADHPLRLDALHNVGTFLSYQGRTGESLPFLREALAGLRRVNGVDHVKTLASETELALALEESPEGQAEALRLRRHVADRRTALYADDPFQLADAHLDLAALCARLGRRDEAVRHARAGLALREALDGDAWLMADARVVLAAAENAGGDPGALAADPAVVRDVETVIEEIGEDQQRAARDAAFIGR